MGSKRKSEMWISNNRVLVGGNKKVTGRNPNFDTEETKLLISLWGDPKVQKTLITTHKKHAVIVKLAEKMREYGYFRSPEEINTRIKNLKCFYNRIKKDMEMGIATDPTWKHYQAMDEIMTRPIFSVRPNEIPKPSLRYRLEEALRDREMNGGDGGISVSGGGSGSSSADKEIDETAAAVTASDEDEQMSITQDMFEDELNDTVEDDVSAATAAAAAAAAEEDGEEEVEVKSPKKEIVDSSGSDVEETPLIIPKQEPIDLDDEMEDLLEKNGEDDDNTDIFPKLSAYLQLTSNNTPTSENNNKIITTIANSANSMNNKNDTTNASVANALQISQPIVIANQQTSQGGKISLVPTNFLLKPPTQQQIQIRPQPQHRILYTKPGGQGHTQGIVTSAPGQMPMKVLLVNTLQKSASSSAGATSAHHTTTITTTDTQIKAINANNIPQQMRPVSSPIVNRDQHNNKHGLGQGSKKKEEMAGFRTLLSKLIQVQTENLEVNRQRLDLERQRLDFEKSAVERIINAVSIFQMPNGTGPLLKPKVEKED